MNLTIYENKSSKIQNYSRNCFSFLNAFMRAVKADLRPSGRYSITSLKSLMRKEPRLFSRQESRLPADELHLVFN